MTDNKFQKKKLFLSSSEISHDVITDITEDARHSGKDYSKPVRICPLTLKTDSVQRTFAHFYTRLDYSMFWMTKVLRQKGQNADAQLCEDALSKLLSTFSTDIGRTISDLDRVITENQTASIFYDHERTFHAPIRCGFSSIFIEITAQLDRLIMLVETLELSCQLSTAESTQLTDSWMKRYRSFCHSINSLRTRIRMKQTMSPTIDNVKTKRDSDSGADSSPNIQTQSGAPVDILAETASNSPHR